MVLSSLSPNPGQGWYDIVDLDDVRMFMLDNLPEEDRARRSWQRACEILLAAADGLADVRAVTRRVELALLLAGQVDGETIKPPSL